MKVPQSLRDLVEVTESLVYLEDLSGRKGLLQAINPLAKLAAVVSMIVVSLFIFNLANLALMCIVPICLAFFSKVPLRQFFSRTALIPLFGAIISLPILFLTAGNPIATTNIGISTLTITSEGLTRFLVFSIRVWFCVASLTLLVLSTGFDKMLKLFAGLRVPPVVVQLFSLTYRYFFVSVHETSSVLMAKEARTYVNRRTLNLQSLRDIGKIMATLFIRTYERSERVYLAMKARGFEIERSSRSTMPPIKFRDLLFSASIIVPFVLLTII